MAPTCPTRVSHPAGTVGAVTFHLTVAGSMEALIDPVSAVLARPLDDPFATEVVAVPGDGVRSWLTARLAERLGVSGPPADGSQPDGIVANVRFVFPSTLVAAAISRLRADANDADGPDPWSVGSLTWTIRAILDDDDVDWRHPLPGRTDLLRCRAIADLFDRYALHRPLMVAAWEGGRDVDAEHRPLPDHQRWQAELWRNVRARLGVASPAELLRSASIELRSGRLEPALPERVLLVGLAGLPGPHLQVLSALSEHRDLHVFAPAASTAMWQRVRALVTADPPRPPIPRSIDPTTAVGEHPLGSLWGRASREAHLLLTSTAVESDAVIELIDPTTTAPPTTLLARLQDDLRHDRPPPGPPADAAIDERFRLAVGDTSICWHTCHGAARQVEVLRDIVLHLLNEREPDGRWRYEPRDIAVLCPDVPAVAPLLEAAFTGLPARGLPEVPLRVADRSLRRQNALADAVLVLLDLLDGRLRASEVLALAQSAPVVRRFGFTADQLDRLTARIADTHVHWGADPDAHRSAGLPVEIDAHSWRHGLDQLLVSVALADPAIARAAGDLVGDDRRLGPAGIAALPDAGDDDLELAGLMAELITRLDHTVRALTTESTVHEWCAALLRAVGDLFAVDDADAWQRRDLEREILRVADEASAAAGGGMAAIPAGELIALVADRLGGRPGRVRFDSGAVTISSLTAQRGVPHRVVCLLGLDGDLGASGASSSDDLTQMAPCVGDRDPRAEVRAQLLDAVLAARERLVILSTGRDIRNNADVPPAIPLAELADLIDATAVPAEPTRSSASAAITIEHPRQAWSEDYFLAEPRAGIAALTPRPWGLDRAAFAAALARRVRRDRPDPLAAPLPDDPLATVSIESVAHTLRNPAATLLRERLGVQLDRDAEPWADLVPLQLDGLAMWRLRAMQLEARLAAGPAWDDAARDRWVEARRREGALPPMALGDAVVATIDEECGALVEAFHTACADVVHLPAIERSVDLDLSPVHTHLPEGSPARHTLRLQGVLTGCRGSMLVHLAPSRFAEHVRLSAWFRLAVLVAVEASAEHEAVSIVRSKNGAKPHVVRFRLRSVDAAHEVLAVVLDLHARARRDLVPTFPETTCAVSRGWSADSVGGGLARFDPTCLDKAAELWRPMNSGSFVSGEGLDPWVAASWGELEFADLLAVPARPDDPPPTPRRSFDGVEHSRLVRWADRLWGTFDSTVVLPDHSSSEDGS